MDLLFNREAAEEGARDDDILPSPVEARRCGGTHSSHTGGLPSYTGLQPSYFLPMSDIRDRAWALFEEVTFRGGHARRWRRPTCSSTTRPGATVSSLECIRVELCHFGSVRFFFRGPSRTADVRLHIHRFPVTSLEGRHEFKLINMIYNISSNGLVLLPQLLPHQQADEGARCCGKGHQRALQGVEREPGEEATIVVTVTADVGPCPPASLGAW
jgi:hypothetical protein